MGRSVDTRRDILNAAVKVIGAKGYAETSVDEIAEQAGLSKGILYYHFDSKADIATRILNQGINIISDLYEEIIAKEPDAATALQAMSEAFVDLNYSNREFGRFLLSEFGRAGRPWSEDIKPAQSRLLGIVAEEIRLAQEQGTARTEIDSDFAALAILGIILSSCMYFIFDTSTAMPKEELSARLNDLIGAAMKMD